MASAPLTALGVASLALLVERPMHPYEMYQLLIQRSEDRIIKVRPGSLYHAVDRLAQQGYLRATGTEREGNRPERTAYEITDAGRLALTARVTEMLSGPVNEYPQFPLAIAEAHNLPKATVIELLNHRLECLRSQLQLLKAGARHVSEKEVQRKYWIDVTYQQAMFAAEISWIENFIGDLEADRIDW